MIPTTATTTVADFELCRALCAPTSNTGPDTSGERDNDESKPSVGCNHTEVVLERHVYTCVMCGATVPSDDTPNREWRYYSQTDTKRRTDPNRCFRRKTEERGIFRDVEKLGFGEKVVAVANQIYEEVTQGKIYRGNSRRGIIFACIFHSYKINGNPMSCEQLIDIFGMDRKIGLRGLKYVNVHAPIKAAFRQYKIQSENLIGEILDRFHATSAQKAEVAELYRRIKNRSSILNRSRPQSVACGLIRYYILKRDNNMSMSYFRSRVRLSELTINRIVREIDTLLGEGNRGC